MLKKYILTYQ